MLTVFPVNHAAPLPFTPAPTVPSIPASPTASSEPRSRSVPQHTFILNSKAAAAEVESDVRLLWVLRDVLGVTGQPRLESLDFKLEGTPV
ncbi:hypothetical protein ACVW0K_000610 [Streptomyces filamentosus]